LRAGRIVYVLLADFLLNPGDQKVAGVMLAEQRGTYAGD
jgi:hypothetical protein